MDRVHEWMEEHPLKLTVIFSIIYLVWFFLLEQFREPVMLVYNPLDRLIPFNQYFIIPYLLWFVYIGWGFFAFYRHSREDYMAACRYIFTGLIICLVIYTVMPTMICLRPRELGTDICSRLVALIYGADTCTNVCPSIHVYNSIAMNMLIGQSETFKDNQKVKTGSLILSVLICLSTVFLKQHSVVDVFWGITLSIILYPLSFKAAHQMHTSRERRLHQM